MQPSTFLGLVAETWIAIGTVGLALATLALFIAALSQTISIRNEARRSRTLAICERYDFDPVLDRCLRNLRRAKASGSFEKDPVRYRIDVSTVLNYLDGIAIGIEQELYIEDLARDHLEPIVRDHVNEYLDPVMAKKLDFDPRGFMRLIRLARAWDDEYTRFQSRWRRRRIRQ